MEFSITLPLPPTLNQQINEARSHWSKSAKTKKHWTNLIAVMLIQQQAPKFEGEIWLRYDWTVSFRNDPDNTAAAAKFINDGLTDAGVIVKDNLTIIQSPVLHFYNKKRAKQEEVCLLQIQDFPHSF